MQYPLPADRQGYAFAGWYTDAACSGGNLFDFTQRLTQNVTLYAKWVETVEYCQGTIPMNGDSEEFTLALGQENLYAFVAPKSGFVTIYTKHHDGGDPYLQLYNANMEPLDGVHDDEHGDGDAEITWEVVGGQVYYVEVSSYSSGIGSIHLDLGFAIDGGIAGIDGKEGLYYEVGQTVTMEIQYDGTLTLETPQWDGHTFLGWYANGNPVESGTWTLDGDVTLTARWEENA
jgi:uncharacterized repeat protein (TIGR02543 family)